MAVRAALVGTTLAAAKLVEMEVVVAVWDTKTVIQSLPAIVILWWLEPEE